MILITKIKPPMYQRHLTKAYFSNQPTQFANSAASVAKPAASNSKPASGTVPPAGFISYILHQPSAIRRRPSLRSNGRLPFLLFLHLLVYHKLREAICHRVEGVLA